MGKEANIAELNEAMKRTSDKRMYERYLTVRLYLEGHKVSYICHLLNRTHVTIAAYWRAYKQNGLSGLVMGHSTGKPRKFTQEQEAQIRELLLQQRPVDVGYEAKFTWTLALLVDWVRREWAMTFTPRGISQVLHRMGFSFTKATYTLAKADTQKQEAFRDVTFPELRQQLEAGKIDHLLFEDESTIRDYQALQYSWFLQGQQHQVKTYGQHKGAKLFGAINYETGKAHHREEEVMDTAAFQRFLQDLLQAYPQGNMVLLLDNSRIHHADELQDFLQAHSRLQLVFLPPYSPELNPVEGLWKWMKSDVVNNVFFHKFYQIKIHVRTFIRRLNQHPQATIDRLLTSY